MGRRVQERFGQRYNFAGNVVQVGGRQFHADFLPYADALMRHPIDVAGTALYKVADSHALPLTDRSDSNLKRAYEHNREQAASVAKEIEAVLREFASSSSAGMHGYLLACGFHAAFGKTYEEWRRSLVH